MVKFIRSFNSTRWILAALILAAFALRLYRLDYQSLRGDEALTYIYTLDSLAELFNVMHHASHHPPLYYIFIFFWLRIAGSSEFALRFPSVLAGVLLAASTARLGKKLVGMSATVAATLLIAVNPYQIFYAQDARSYPLLTLLGVLSTLALLNALQREDWRGWVLYGLSVLAGMYAHYYFPFIVVFQAVFLLGWVWLGRKKFPWKYVAVGVADVILYLPWMLFTWQLVSAYTGSGRQISLVESLWLPLLAFGGSQFLPENREWMVVAVFLLPLALGIVTLWQRKKDSAALLVLYLLVPLVGIGLAGLNRTTFNERYLILASPAYLLLAATGVEWLARSKRINLRLPVVIWIIGGVVLTHAALLNLYDNPQYAKSPPWREVLNVIADKAQPGDAVVYTSPEATVVYYNRNRLPLFPVPAQLSTSADDTAVALADLLKNYDRLWLIPIKSPNPAADGVEPWLNRYGIRTDQKFFRILHINLYESPNYFLTTIVPQPVTFADGITLRGFRVGSKNKPSYSVRPGDKLSFTLVWQASARPVSDYTVFTHLMGEDGQLYGQWDNIPAEGQRPTSNWRSSDTIFDSYFMPVSKSAPPGKYQLQVGMYDSATGARLPVLDSAGNPAADHVVLDVIIRCK